MGIVPAEDFIEVARQRNMMGEIGLIVLETAASRFAKSERMRHWKGRFSVNLSVAELNDPRLLDQLRWTLDKAGLEPERIAVEIPCSVIYERGSERIAKVAAQLRRLGMSVVIDGIEPGTLGLIDISRMQASMGKLSGSFTEAGMASRRGHDEMAQTIAQLQGIGVAVFANAISSVEMANTARSAGVDGLQGYLFAEPLELDRYEERYFGNTPEKAMGRSKR